MSAHAQNMCGQPPYYLTGWLGGFLFWNSAGYPQFERGFPDVEIDGQNYPAVIFEDIPVAYAKVPVTLVDDAIETQLFAVAGGLGKRITAGAPDGFKTLLHRQDSGRKQDEICDAPPSYSAVTTPFDSDESLATGCWACLKMMLRRRGKRDDRNLRDIKARTVDQELDPECPGDDFPDPRSDKTLQLQGSLQPISGWILYDERNAQSNPRPYFSSVDLETAGFVPCV